MQILLNELSNVCEHKQIKSLLTIFEIFFSRVCICVCVYFESDVYYMPWSETRKFVKNFLWILLQRNFVDPYVYIVSLFVGWGNGVSDLDLPRINPVPLLFRQVSHSMMCYISVLTVGGNNR